MPRQASFRLITKCGAISAAEWPEILRKSVGNLKKVTSDLNPTQIQK